MPSSPGTALSVVHFVLDHRVGGPHVYVKTLNLALGDSAAARLVTAGRGAMTDVALLNLRRVHRALYPLEVLINALLIVLRFGLWRRADLFHVHGAANLAPLLAAFVCRLPVVWHFHETVQSQRALAVLGSWLVQRSRHAVLTVSRGGALAFSHPDAALVPGAVDTGFWRPVDGPREDSGRLHLVSVANLNPLKGLDLLLGALAGLDGPVRLTLVGAELATQAGHARQLRQAAEHLQRSQPRIEVVFAGSLAPAQVRDVLQQADVFVLPSRSEACPIALLEAMAMQRPCVATDVGDVRAVLPTAQQPYVCPPGDEPALAAALRAMAALAPAERRALGAANRATIVQHHSPAGLARRVLQVYRTLCRPGTPTA